jgi:hypothetical protein
VLEHDGNAKGSPWPIMHAGLLKERRMMESLCVLCTLCAMRALRVLFLPCDCLTTEIYSIFFARMMPSYFFLNQVIVSSAVIRWFLPIFAFCRLRLETRKPRRFITT